MNESVTKSLVKKILEQPFEYNWSIQGLGMLRLYLDDVHRLHIWNSQYAVRNVSQMHTHPWNFRSLVVAGVVKNERYIEVTTPDDPEVLWYNKQTIFCGVGGGLVGNSSLTTLISTGIETYVERETYTEEAHEIHVSRPEDGTVTIINREYLDDADHALVFWEDGDWVSAEPRPANNYEIADFTTLALSKWF